MKRRRRRRRTKMKNTIARKRKKRKLGKIKNKINQLIASVAKMLTPKKMMKLQL
jgi:hypothetical protein